MERAFWKLRQNPSTSALQVAKCHIRVKKNGKKLLGENVTYIGLKILELQCRLPNVPNIAKITETDPIYLSTSGRQHTSKNE